MNNTTLSSAAYHVLDAVMDHDKFRYSRLAAAALRTAALYCKRDRILLLALADELESINGQAFDPNC